MVNLGEAYRKDEQKTNKRRTMNEGRTVRAARADREKMNKRRCDLHEQMRERRIKDGAIQMGR